MPVRRARAALCAAAGRGRLLASYRWAVASGLVPESAAPCSQGVPCSVEQIVWFGFVTLPMLSVLAFSVIIALLLSIAVKGTR